MKKIREENKEQNRINGEKRWKKRKKKGEKKKRRECVKERREIWRKKIRFPDQRSVPRHKINHYGYYLMCLRVHLVEESRVSTEERPRRKKKKKKKERKKSTNNVKGDEQAQYSLLTRQHPKSYANIRQRFNNAYYYTWFKLGNAETVTWYPDRAPMWLMSGLLVFINGQNRRNGWVSKGYMHVNTHNYTHPYIRATIKKYRDKTFNYFFTQFFWILTMMCAKLSN